MATSLYAEQEADFAFKGDYVTVAGTLDVTGITTAAGGLAVTGTITATNAKLTTPTITGATLTGTITSSGMTLTTLKMSAPSGTTAGAVWTSGAPTLTAEQMYIKVTAGSTVYRIPVFLDA